MVDAVADKLLGSAYFWIGINQMNDLDNKNKLISEYGSDKFTMGLYCGILIASIVIAISLVAFGKFG